MPSSVRLSSSMRSSESGSPLADGMPAKTSTSSLLVLSTMPSCRDVVPVVRRCRWQIAHGVHIAGHTTRNGATCAYIAWERGTRRQRRHDMTRYDLRIYRPLSQRLPVPLIQYHSEAPTKVEKGKHNDNRASQQQGKCEFARHEATTLRFHHPLPTPHTHSITLPKRAHTCPPSRTHSQNAAH